MHRRIGAICLSLALLLGLFVPAARAAEGAFSPETDDPMEFKLARPREWMEMTGMTDPGAGVQAPRVEAPGDITYDSFQPRALKTGETLLKGIDVSEYQDRIDWKAVAGNGVEFAFIRAAFRGWGPRGTLMIDSEFQRNIRAAKASGLLVGAYIFSQATTPEEGREEAQFLIRQLQGERVDLPLVIDFEYAGDFGRLYNAKLTRAAATAVCNAFCQEIEKSGYESMVYANPSMLRDQLDREKLGRVWLAHYTTATGYTGAYEYWQCTSQGTIKGISGVVDLDFWFRPGTAGEGPTTPSTGPEPELPEFAFTDVPTGSWYYETVRQAFDAGIVNGTTTTTFSPGDQVLRSQVVTMLYRMEGSPEVEGETTFLDLQEPWYLDAVTWAFQKKVINGYSDLQFAPNDKIVRQDLAAILYRNAGTPAVSGQELLKFSDADQVADYAQDALEWAVESGIMNGNENAIMPADPATRAEACAMLMRYRSYLEKKTTTEQ